MKFLLLIPVFVVALVRSDEPDTVVLRRLFYQSTADSKAADKLYKVLNDVNEHSSSLLICYKGVAEMMQAKHAINPLNKLFRFNKGKTLIDEAIKRDPGNLEQRFLRFAIQSNLPGFLGYNDELKEDKLKLLDGVPEMKDEILREKIVDYLITSKYCTVAELKRIE